MKFLSMFIFLEKLLENNLFINFEINFLLSNVLGDIIKSWLNFKVFAISKHFAPKNSALTGGVF